MTGASPADAPRTEAQREGAPPPGGAPDPERLRQAVRRGLGLDAEEPVSLAEIGEHSNINYVYRVEAAGRRLYLKVVPERPKRLAAPLPRERIFSEAEGLRRFRALAGGAVVIPEVLFVDRGEMALGMSDVGEGRQVLFDRLGERFELLGEQAEALGRALGAVHGGTRGDGPLRPPGERAVVRGVIFEGLMAPGARAVFPELWDEVGGEMQTHDQCLVHADLWSKNLLVRSGTPVAVVDFEGVFYGDPAFDLGTLAAVALLPALERPERLEDALGFVSRLLGTWASHCGDSAWPPEVERRTFRAVATFLAARGFGPFAYTLDDAARHRLAGLARSLAAEPPAAWGAFAERVRLHAAADGQPD